MTKRAYKPWLPVTVEKQPLHDCHVTEAQVRCLQLLNEGKAQADEQKIALQAVFHICGINDLEFLPDEHGGERGTAFKGGKRFVGTQIRKLITQPLNLLTGET